MAKEMFSIEQLKEMGVKLLTKEELKKVDSGDFIDCDTLHQSLLHAGYNVEYKNVHEDKNGFLAHFFLDGGYIGAVDNDGRDHMVRDWRGIDVNEEKEYEVIFSLTRRVTAKTEEEAVLKAEKNLSEEVSCEHVFVVDQEE